jgi:hypothetical protein
MERATRPVCAREKSFKLYTLHLAGEVQFSGWSMRVGRDALIAAISAGRAGARVGRVVLVVCEGGLAVRSGLGSAEVAGRGFWASPVAVWAGQLRQALRREKEEWVQLEFGKGRLMVNGQSVPGREV